MMAIDQFADLSTEVAKLNGLTKNEAAAIVAKVGDTPELDDSGNVIFEGSALRWPFDE